MGKKADWGLLGNLTEKQTAALEEFRREFGDDLDVNGCEEETAVDRKLLRFLRARQFNLRKSAKMLREDIAFRKSLESHGFFSRDDFDCMVAMCEEGFIYRAGEDKQGRPAIVYKAKHFWPSLVTRDADIILFFCFYMDCLVRMADAKGLDGFTCIADLKGWGMSNFSLAYTKVSVRLLQDHYPERLGKVNVVNAPWVFNAAWRMVRPLLDERTRSKINVCRKMEYLKKDYDEAVLEEQYGGTHEPYACPDHILTRDLGRTSVRGRRASTEIEAASPKATVGTGEDDAEIPTAIELPATPAKSASTPRSTTSSEKKRRKHWWNVPKAAKRMLSKKAKKWKEETPPHMLNGSSSMSSSALPSPGPSPSPSTIAEEADLDRDQRVAILEERLQNANSVFADLQAQTATLSEALLFSQKETKELTRSIDSITRGVKQMMIVLFACVLAYVLREHIGALLPSSLLRLFSSLM